eukprot:6470839-Amphidinium_carterae.2
MHHIIRCDQGNRESSQGLSRCERALSTPLVPPLFQYLLRLSVSVSPTLFRFPSSYVCLVSHTCWCRPGMALNSSNGLSCDLRTPAGKVQKYVFREAVMHTSPDPFASRPALSGLVN